MSAVRAREHQRVTGAERPNCGEDLQRPGELAIGEGLAGMAPRGFAHRGKACFTSSVTLLYKGLARMTQDILVSE